MARAKRTTRAEARRRYRAEHGLLDDTSPRRGAGHAAATPPARRAKPVGDRPAPTRLGIGTAFRLAFRPLDVRARPPSPALARCGTRRCGCRCC